MKVPKLGLFSRFFLLFGITTILLGLCFTAAYYVMSEKEALQQLTTRKETILAFLREIESTPPEQYSLHKYAEEIRGGIVIEKQGRRYSIEDDFPEMSVLLANARQHGEFLYTKYHAKYYLLYEQQDGWIAITSTPFNLMVYSQWVVYWPWLLVFLILAVSYGILRHWLMPLSEIFTVTKSVSSGDFSQRIEFIPNNEFADLVIGVNKMIDDVNTMMEAKNGLLLAVSHELRTPLARMQISLAMAEKSSHTQDIAQDIQHMEQLIEQLLEGERLKSGHHALHITNHYLPMVIEEVLAEPDLSGKVSVKDTVPEIGISIDVGRFKFLLRNLLSNAVKHNPIETTVELSIVEKDNQLVIEVSDAGQGIPKESLGHLFEPFYCVKHIDNRDTKGTGLGLYLCESIAHAHGGTISVASELGKGSRFSVALPLIQANS